MNAAATRSALTISDKEWSGTLADRKPRVWSPAQGADDPLPGIVGDSPAIRAVCCRTRVVAMSRANVLLIGETGTGKEVIARNIHQLSTRAEGPYIRVNCGALTESLLESELFGHVEGAFTGAIENKIGRFEAAHGGTIFLDEINSVSFKLQAKLLRVLQEREFERVGESRTIRVDTRVVSATNACLEKEVAAGRFRQDLYYRLNVVPIYLPPLRERKEDLPAIASYFLARYCKEIGRDLEEIPAGILEQMKRYDWPGNVRELENHIERVVALSRGRRLDFEQLLPAPQQRSVFGDQGEPADFDSRVHRMVRAALRDLPADESDLYGRVMATVERELIEQIMPVCNNVTVRAAARLGINRNTLFKKLMDLKKHRDTVSIALDDSEFLASK